MKIRRMRNEVVLYYYPIPIQGIVTVIGVLTSIISPYKIKFTGISKILVDEPTARVDSFEYVLLLF